MSLMIPSVPTTFGALLILVVALLILWVVVSIPVYFAGKAITLGNASFGDAMGATLGGGVAYVVVYYGVTLFLGTLLGAPAVVFAFILALLVWLAVYRASFDTGWLQAVGIVAVAWVILLVLDVVLVQTFGVGFPRFYPF